MVNSNVEFLELNKIIKNPERYAAHKRMNGNSIVWETLEEHTLCCQKYFKNICEHKCIAEYINRFFYVYKDKWSEAGIALAEEMWCNIVTFHDTGKHNPNFQINIMSKQDVKKNLFYRQAGNRHSSLSAALYMDYYFKEIKKIGGEEGKWLCVLMLCNAYTIARHHSGLCSFSKFIESYISENNKYILEKLETQSENFYQENFKLTEIMIRKFKRLLDMQKDQSKRQGIWMFFYQKFTYSLLAAADYYATAEYSSGISMEFFGEIDDISSFLDIYEKTPINEAIRMYEVEKYPMNTELLQSENKINQLRNELFLDSERQLLKETEKSIFYLEAPTGSGKSNISINLSLQLAFKDKRLKKIFYVYPYNTLVEQNQEVLKNVFGGNEDIINYIMVVNSVTPIAYIQRNREKEEKDESGSYEQALLDRQFLNSPMLLTTHVSLFDIIFGDSRESVFAFHQLAGSIIVLDEIQSYKNTIWGEIITFLTELAEFLHMKLIIMSATLPNLEILKNNSEHTEHLILDRRKYFCHPCFQKRVEIDNELLKEKITIEQLYQHVKRNCGNKKKILIAFITKKRAEEFFCLLKQDQKITETIYCMTGDDSILERKKVIQKVKKEEKGLILVATQVVEAGVDIDMDIGYKNIAKMDSEEQFLGRINRSYTKGRMGKVYFFKLDAPKNIYCNDIRVEQEFSIERPEIWDMLCKKDFSSYYNKILGILMENYIEMLERKFFLPVVNTLNFPEVTKHMKLIEEDKLRVSVYFGREIMDDENNEIIDGRFIWQEYKKLLQNMKMRYAEKIVKLSQIRAKMTYFIYELDKNVKLCYTEQIGDLFYIEEGEQYFQDGRLKKNIMQGMGAEFI